MSLDRILMLLQDLGLSKDEAEVYVYLAKKGPQTIKTIEESLKKNPEEIMKALKGLEDKQITIKKSKRSIFFLAIPFEKLLTNYAKIRFNQAKRIEQTRLSFLADWKDTIEEKDQIEQNNH
jgi:sugar-specific transcriptional regulator TrmB